jgi:hypothetical protein
MMLSVCMSSVGIQPTSKKQAKPRQPHAAVPLLACRPNAPSVHCMHNIAAPERAGRTPQGCRARAPRAALPLRTCRARQTCVGCPSPSPARRIKCTARAGSCAAGAAATDAAAHFDGALVAEVRVGPARSGLSARSACVRARNLEQLLCNLQHTTQGRWLGGQAMSTIYRDPCQHACTYARDDATHAAAAVGMAVDRTWS